MMIPRACYLKSQLLISHNLDRSCAKPRVSVLCDNRLLKLDLGAQALEIAVNDGDGQLLAIASIGDRAVSRLGVELSLDVSAIPFVGMPNIRDTGVVLLGPEERDRVKCFPARSAALAPSR